MKKILCPVLEDLSQNATTVNYLIHNGKALHEKKGVEARNMKCPSCKGNQGYLCQHGKEIAWFCSNSTCLEDSAEKSKVESREEWNFRMFGNKDASYKVPGKLKESP